jgi:predicted Zn-dependent protease
MASTWNQQLPMDELGRERLLQAIDGIVVGTNPRQGFVRNNTFHHPDLAFRFPVPENWTLYNLTTKVAMIDEESQAIVILTLAEGDNVVDAASSFAQETQVDVRDHGERLVNGLNAYFIDASFQQEQQPLRLVAYFIAHGDLIYQFIAYTHAHLFSDKRAKMTRPALGFQEENEPAILSIQPDRLQVFTANRSGQFSSFVGALPEQFEQEDIAILNQLELSTSISSGQKLKLINR